MVKGGESFRQLKDLKWEKIKEIIRLTKSQNLILKAKTASKDLGKLKSQFDPSGSYTGVDYDDKYSTPVQDADDLW